MICKECRHYDETAYAFDNHHASGRFCYNRDPYEPDLSPFHTHSEFPFVTHSSSCCRAWQPLTFQERVTAGNAEGRLFAI